MTKLSDAIKNHQEILKSQHQQDITARKEYLQHCETEANRIFTDLADEILNDISSFGKSFIDVRGRYDNIFKPRISGIIAERLRKENLELRLFYSIGIVEVFISI